MWIFSRTKNRLIAAAVAVKSVFRHVVDDMIAKDGRQVEISKTILSIPSDMTLTSRTHSDEAVNFAETQAFCVDTWTRRS